MSKNRKIYKTNKLQSTESNHKKKKKLQKPKRNKQANKRVDIFMNIAVLEQSWKMNSFLCGRREQMDRRLASKKRKYFLEPES